MKGDGITFKARFHVGEVVEGAVLTIDTTGWTEEEIAELERLWTIAGTIEEGEFDAAEAEYVEIPAPEGAEGKR